MTTWSGPLSSGGKVAGENRKIEGQKTCRGQAMLSSHRAFTSILKVTGGSLWKDTGRKNDGYQDLEIHIRFLHKLFFFFGFIDLTLTRYVTGFHCMHVGCQIKNHLYKHRVNMLSSILPNVHPGTWSWDSWLRAALLFCAPRKRECKQGSSRQGAPHSSRAAQTHTYTDARARTRPLQATD